MNSQTINKLNKNICLSLLIIFTSLLSSLTFAHGDGHQKQNNPLFSGLDSSAARVVKQFHNALKNGDEKLARSLLADDVLIYEGGGIERSAEQYASHHMKADIKYLKALTIKRLEHQVKVVGDMAYSTATTTMKGEYKGKKINSNSMETIVLQKNNGGWQISHIHWSN